MVKRNEMKKLEIFGQALPKGGGVHEIENFSYKTNTIYILSLPILLQCSGNEVVLSNIEFLSITTRHGMASEEN